MMHTAAQDNLRQRQIVLLCHWLDQPERLEGGVLKISCTAHLARRTTIIQNRPSDGIWSLLLFLPKKIPPATGL
jgi:hypothetical protein